MDGFDIANLIYLSALCLAVLGWVVVENRTNIGKTARMALAWGMIFFGVVAAYGLWEDIRRDVLPRQAVLEGGTIEAPRGPGGHYRLTVSVNDTPIDFLVDTGATDIVLTMEDARRVGLDPDRLAFVGIAQTANGEVRTARAFAESVSLGPVRFEGVPVAVNGGEMSGSLLGMAFLNRFERIEITGDRLRLTP